MLNYPGIVITEILLLIIKYAVPGLIAIFGVWIGFVWNRNHNNKILNRESLRVIRPTISRLIKLCLTIQATYKLEDDINLPPDKVNQGISPRSLYQKFLELNKEFEEKSVEIIDVVNPRIKKLIGIISQRAIAVKTFLPSKNASLNFYHQVGPNKALQRAMRDYLEDLGKI